MFSVRFATLAATLLTASGVFFGSVGQSAAADMHNTPLAILAEVKTVEVPQPSAGLANPNIAFPGTPFDPFDPPRLLEPESLLPTPAPGGPPNVTNTDRDQSRLVGSGRSHVQAIRYPRTLGGRGLEDSRDAIFTAMFETAATFDPVRYGQIRATDRVLLYEGMTLAIAADGAYRVRCEAEIPATSVTVSMLLSAVVYSPHEPPYTLGTIHLRPVALDDRELPIADGLTTEGEIRSPRLGYQPYGLSVLPSRTVQLEFEGRTPLARSLGRLLTHDPNVHVRIERRGSVRIGAVAERARYSVPRPDSTENE